MAKTYTFHIDAYSPETIPMARLAAYMQNLAALLGHQDAVHFERLERGSTKLVTRITHEHVPKVDADLQALLRGEGQPEAQKARKAIDRLLEEDNASGFVYEDGEAESKVIEFPGVNKNRPLDFGVVREDGSLDDILISVGGADRTAHVRLQKGDTKYANIDTTREMARNLAKFLFEPIRLFGTGNWMRDESGVWILKRFRVSAFEALETGDLKGVIAKMRSEDGSGWRGHEGPLLALRDAAGDESGPN